MRVQQARLLELPFHNMIDQILIFKWVYDNLCAFCRQRRDVQEALWRLCITSSLYHRTEKDQFTIRASMYCDCLLFQQLNINIDDTKAIASTLSSVTISTLPRFAIIALAEIQYI